MTKFSRNSGIPLSGQTPNNNQYSITNIQTRCLVIDLLVIGVCLVIGVWLLVISPVCFASNEAALVKQGNELYQGGKLDEALKSYNQALTAAPQEPLINFNIGNGLYRKAQYKEAAQAYEKALLSGDKKIEAGANYNIGNCKFKQGKFKESSDLAGAVAEYRSALDYYKRAMELDPNDMDAKFNYEFVERLLKTLIDKLAKQSSSAKASQDRQQQQKQGQQGSQQEKQKEDQQQKGQQKAQEQQEGQQMAQEAQGQQAEQQQQGQEPQGVQEIGGEIQHSGKEPDKEMSKEQARILLDDYRQREQQDRQLSGKHAPPRYPDVEKDW